MTPSTNGPSAPYPTAPGPERSTTSTATPNNATTKPCAPWATAWWASCTAAYATTRPTTNTPPGHTGRPQLDNLGTWDVYSCSNLLAGNGRWDRSRIELAHEFFEEPAMRGVLRGGKQPSAVGPHSDGGVHPGVTSIPPPCPLHHGAVCVDQRHVGRQKPQLGDLCIQARSL